MTAIARNIDRLKNSKSVIAAVCLPISVLILASINALALERSEIEVPISSKPHLVEHPISISFKNGRLDVDAENAPAADILKAVSNHTGVPIDFEETISGRATLHMQNGTIDAFFRRLSKSHAVVYERLKDGSYRVVKAGVFAMSDASGSPGSKPRQGSGSEGNITSGEKGSAGEARMQTADGALAIQGGFLDRKGRPRFRRGELLVRLKPGVSAEKVDILHASLGSRVVSSMERRRLQKIVLRNGLDEEDAIRSYMASSLVENAEKHALRYANGFIPNDPYYADQWGLPMIRAPEAWAAGKDLPEVVVAVIDSGIDYTHPDLQDAMWINRLEVDGLPGWDDDRNGCVDDYHGCDFAGPYQFSLVDDRDGDPADIDGHGTHVAGIVGARIDNGRGIAGIARNVCLMALKVQADDSLEEMESWDIIRAIGSAMDNGAKIVNCSFGGEEDSREERDAFHSLEDKGILTICAAGNDGSDNDVTPMYPASYPFDNIISVAAGDQIGALAGFSNYGAASVDVMAPGVSILSAGDDCSYTEARVSCASEGQPAITSKYAWGMVYAGTTSPEGLTGHAYDCGLGYPDEFPAGIQNFIALIKRGPADPPFFFSEKVEYAMAAGAIGVIIYDHTPGTEHFCGTLGEDRQWIPVVFVPKEDGESMLNLSFPVEATVVNSMTDSSEFYAYKDGTSMAAPAVAGVAAMMLGRNPSLSYLDLKSRLLESVQPVPSLAGKIRAEGRIDAFSALCRAKTTPGDLTCDGDVGLDDALISTQLAAGLARPLCPSCIPNGLDIGGNGRIGVEETVFILQQAADTGN